MAAGEAKPFAKKIDERRAHLHGLAHILAVYREGDGAGVLGHGRCGFSLSVRSGFSIRIDRRLSPGRTGVRPPHRHFGKTKYP
jgi:hypothetical protein